MKPISLVFIALLLCHSAWSQQVNRCFTAEAIQMMDAAHPGFKDAAEATFLRAQQFALQNGNQRGAAKLRIPVVVHVVYKNATENLSDSLIHSQIKILNEDYNRQNDDTSNTRTVFDTIAGAGDIEFYLAKIDPDSNITTGITRTATTEQSFFDIFSGSMDKVKFDSLGGKSGWPADKYLNIWVCDLSLFGIPAVMGFAYPPANAPNWPSGQGAMIPDVEGVVLHYAAFGRKNPSATGLLNIVNRGRSCTHEVGHYLGLRHVWGDGPCTADDGINDTPKAAGDAQQSCAFKNTCTDAPFDFPDMIENFMDYAADSCMNMFTKGQFDLMRNMILSERPGLLWNADSIPVIDTTDTTGTAIIDISRNDKEAQIRIYPNPAAKEFALNISFGKNTDFTFQIFNMAGKVLYSEVSANSSGYSGHVSMMDSPAGMYILRVTTSEGHHVHKKIMLQ